VEREIEIRLIALRLGGRKLYNLFLDSKPPAVSGQHYTTFLVDDVCIKQSQSSGSLTQAGLIIAAFSDCFLNPEVLVEQSVSFEVEYLQILPPSTSIKSECLHGRQEQIHCLEPHCQQLQFQRTKGADPLSQTSLPIKQIPKAAPFASEITHTITATTTTTMANPYTDFSHGY